jgi:hypothetical protein
LRHALIENLTPDEITNRTAPHINTGIAPNLTNSISLFDAIYKHNNKAGARDHNQAIQPFDKSIAGRNNPIPHINPASTCYAFQFHSRNKFK